MKNILFFLLLLLMPAVYAQKAVPVLQLIVIQNGDTLSGSGDEPKLLFSGGGETDVYERHVSYFEPEKIRGKKYNILRILTATLDLQISTARPDEYFDAYFPPIYPVNKLIVKYYPRADEKTWKRLVKTQAWTGTQDIVVWSTAFSDAEVINLRTSSR
ncbi:MAG: hypothetical protein IBJ09_10085 [Bacteroidia bacterium]|nr:hypothetical protein [Bacteroidia bacterium]